VNFAQVLRRSSRLNPGATVLLDHGRRVDYLALEMAAQRIATILVRRHRVAPGDRVAVLLPDTQEFAFVVYGILWAGAVVGGLDTEIEPDVLTDTLSVLEPKLLIGWHALAELVEPVGRAVGMDWLLVEPREFSRLLAATPPRAPLVDVAGDAPAIILEAGPLVELGHADLAIRASDAARKLGLEPGAVVEAPAALSDPASQVRTLHAAVAAGAALSLAAEPVVEASSRTRIVGHDRRRLAEPTRLDEPA